MQLVVSAAHVATETPKNGCYLINKNRGSWKLVLVLIFPRQWAHHVQRMNHAHSLPLKPKLHRLPMPCSCANGCQKPGLPISRLGSANPKPPPDDGIGHRLTQVGCQIFFCVKQLLGKSPVDCELIGRSLPLNNRR